MVSSCTLQSQEDFQAGLHLFWRMRLLSIGEEDKEYDLLGSILFVYPITNQQHSMVIILAKGCLQLDQFLLFFSWEAIPSRVAWNSIELFALVQMAVKWKIA